jgi:hypothetical protein
MASLRRGQNLMEIAVIIATVGLVIYGMETYVKRSVQGKVKNLTDYIISDKQANENPNGKTTAKDSTFSLHSTMVATEGIGGNRSFKGDEVSNSSYSSK